jgi:hypothetical protein
VSNHSPLKKSFKHDFFTSKSIKNSVSKCNESKCDTLSTPLEYHVLLECPVTSIFKGDLTPVREDGLEAGQLVVAVVVGRVRVVVGIVALVPEKKRRVDLCQQFFLSIL